MDDTNTDCSGSTQLAVHNLVVLIQITPASQPDNDNPQLNGTLPETISQKCECFGENIFKREFHFAASSAGGAVDDDDDGGEQSRAEQN